VSRKALLAAALLLACGPDASDPAPRVPGMQHPPPTPAPSVPTVAPRPPEPADPGAAAEPTERRFGLGDDVLPPPGPLPEAVEPEILDKLRSGYPVERIEGLQELDADGVGLDLALELLDWDGNAEVRLAAVEKVSEGLGYSAVAGLVRALDDPDPRVVVAAIHGLENAGDDSVVPELEPLLQHRDDRVRTVAAAALELLR
jgi:hypothetical protein